MATAILRASTVAISLLAATCPANVAAQNLGDIVDVGLEFRKPQQTLFAASRLTAFDVATGRGTLQWDRYTLQPSLNFNKIDVGYTRAPATEFPGTEYDRDPALPFDISFVSPRTLPIRVGGRVKWRITR